MKKIRERERERERQTDRQTDRQTEQTDRPTDRQTDRNKETDIDRGSSNKIRTHIMIFRHLSIIAIGQIVFNFLLIRV